MKFLYHNHLDTPHLVGLHWTSDRPVAETSTWNTQHSQNTHATARAHIANKSATQALDRAATGIGW